jgi:hypothetical protein
LKLGPAFSVPTKASSQLNLCTSCPACIFASASFGARGASRFVLSQVLKNEPKWIVSKTTMGALSTNWQHSF